MASEVVSSILTGPSTFSFPLDFAGGVGADGCVNSITRESLQSAIDDLKSWRDDDPRKINLRQSGYIVPLGLLQKVIADGLAVDMDGARAYFLDHMDKLMSEWARRANERMNANPFTRTP